MGAKCCVVLWSIRVIRTWESGTLSSSGHLWLAVSEGGWVVCNLSRWSNDEETALLHPEVKLMWTPIKPRLAHIPLLKLTENVLLSWYCVSVWHLIYIFSFMKTEGIHVWGPLCKHSFYPANGLLCEAFCSGCYRCQIASLSSAHSNTHKLHSHARWDSTCMFSVGRWREIGGMSPPTLSSSALVAAQPLIFPT